MYRDDIRRKIGILEQKLKVITLRGKRIAQMIMILYYSQINFGTWKDEDNM